MTKHFSQIQPTKQNVVQTKQNTTMSIDEKHSEMLKKFHEAKTVTLPLWKQEKEQWTKQLEEPNLPIEKKMEINDKIAILNKKIAKTKREEKNYFLENAKYIFQYFEDKKKISHGSNNQNTNNINTFFKRKDAEQK